MRLDFAAADPGIMWAMARGAGQIERDNRRGTYCVRFRWVRFPTADKPRQVRLYRLIGGTPIGRQRQRAEVLLEGIRAELQQRGMERLPKILSRYLDDRAPENAFRGHWQRFLEKNSEDLEDGEIGPSRHKELASLERRGYLDDLLDLSIHAIDARALEGWRKGLQRRKSKKGGTLSRKTVWHVVHDVGTFLRWLKRYGDIDDVPELPEVRLGQTHRPSVPTEDALRRYLDTIPEDARGIFLIRAYNGLRMPEARALRVGDYNPKARTVKLRWSKTGELPTLPVDWEVAQWIEKHVDLGQPFRPLFRNPATDEQWSYSSERRVHVKACEKIGAYYRMNHCGRHAFGTHAMARTKDLEAVAKAMRHADVRTTQGYLDRDQLDIVHVLRPRGAA